MKIFLILLIVSLISIGSAYAYNYAVSGHTNDGEYVYGNVTVDQDGGDGFVVDEEGNPHPVDVEWTGHGGLEAYDHETGEYYDLEVISE